MDHAPSCFRENSQSPTTSTGEFMSAVKTPLTLAIVAATAGLMLVATADTSFAAFRGSRGPHPCTADCQANKARSPTTGVTGKVQRGGGGNNDGRNYKQQ
jgi:hypothetical protein